MFLFIPEEFSNFFDIHFEASLTYDLNKINNRELEELLDKIY